jgi:hypothetical protein
LKLNKSGLTCQNIFLKRFKLEKKGNIFLGKIKMNMTEDRKVDKEVFV